YFIVGDAACFIDPLLSSGVHLATFSATLAAACLLSTWRGEIAESDARAFFEQTYRRAYLRFMVLVSAFYDRARGREAYYREARRLSHHDYDRQELRAAFVSVVSGVEDVNDVEQMTEHVVEEVNKGVDADIALRRDKEALRRMDDAMR